jgi:hypothetical protein
MPTIWKSGNNDKTYTGTTLSSWSRQQKFAMLAGFVILGVLLGISACSKQSAKPALVGVSTPTATPAESAVTTTAQPTPAAPKKAQRKRPANVTYRDTGSGLSFVYPRKYGVTVGEKAAPQFGDLGNAPMNFVEPGGITVATVTVPDTTYPGTDFTTAFFNVNLNRNLTEAQCSQFAFVNNGDADAKAEDSEKTAETTKAPSEKVTIGSKQMSSVDDFAGNALEQAEAKYYHSYENGACYEYVLGLGTAGFGTGTIDAVDRDKVFQKLEKIMATVKVAPGPQEEKEKDQVAKQTTTAEPAKTEPAKSESARADAPATTERKDQK